MIKDLEESADAKDRKRAQSWTAERVGFIIVNMIQTRPPQSNKSRGTNDYEETRKTISHYADINSKAVKPSINADLTPTADHSKQDYEIAYTMQSNIYANITT